MKIRHSNRSGYPESDNAASECAWAILGGKPSQLSDGGDRDHHPDYASDDGSREEPRLPGRVAEDGPDHGAKACQPPSSDEDRYRLQGIASL